MKCGGLQWPQKILQSGIELEVNIYIDVISDHIEALCMDPRSQVKIKEPAQRKLHYELKRLAISMTKVNRLAK